MGWSPGNYSGGGVWRSLGIYSARKTAKTSAQTVLSTSGDLVRTLSPCSVVSVGLLATIIAPRVGVAAVTLGGATSSSTGQLQIKGALAATLAPATLQATVGPLITPTVTNVSATGTAPLILSLTNGDYVAGRFLEWEFAGSLTPPTNANGSYTTPTQRGVTFIDGDSWARLDLALGYTDPAGAFAFHCRILRDNPSGATTVTDQRGGVSTYDASAWTTDYTDSIIESSALLTSTIGTSKSQYLDVPSPFHQWIHKANVGALCASRATLAAVNTKWHAEFRIDGFGSGAFWFCGISDGYVSGDASRPSFATYLLVKPGAGSGSSAVRGLTVACGLGSTSLTVSRNGAAPAVALTGVTGGAAVNDRVILECDSTNKQVLIRFYDASASFTTGVLATITIDAEHVPSNWFHFGGGGHGTGTVATSDSGTAFFDPADWLVTPTTGYENFYA